MTTRVDVGFKRDFQRLKVEIDHISFLLFQESSGGSPALYDSIHKLVNVFNHISYYRTRLVDEVAKHADAMKRLPPLPFARDEETFCSVSLHFAVIKWREIVPKMRKSIATEQYMFMELRHFFYRTLYIPCYRLSPTTHERLRNSYRHVTLIGQALLDIEKCCQSLVEYYSYWEGNLRRGARQLKYQLQPEIKIQMLESWQLCISAWETIDAIILNERAQRNVFRNRAHTVPEASDCAYNWSVAKKDTSSLSALPDRKTPVKVDPVLWPALAKALEKEEERFDIRHPELARSPQPRSSCLSSKSHHAPSRHRNKERLSAGTASSPSTPRRTPPTSVTKKSGEDRKKYTPVPRRLVRAHTTPMYLESGPQTVMRLHPQDQFGPSLKHVSQVGKGYHQNLRS